MTERGISQIPVTHAGSLIGMVKEEDILKYLSTGEITPQSILVDVMERSVPTVEESTSISALQEILSNATCAVVIDSERKPKHILTKIDLVDWMCKNRSSTT
jgi:cystathionine beta-synthase